MHLPRDLAEWIVMGGLMAAVMGGGMLGVHALRAHLRGGGRQAMEGGPAMRLGTAVVGLLLRAGIPVAILGPMQLLTVVGRRSGRPRTLPVDVHDVLGGRYLVATHGEGAWVHNLRAAGAGELRLGRRRWAFRATELAAAEATPVLRAALGALLASDGWRGRGLRANLGVGATPSDAELARAAATHPVFRLEAAGTAA